ncbi:hypothetical protein CEUSTIGMA_g9261.t1 [Chlamydomonas eustigma]|uniref:Cytokinin riboside 5'-monophosphate phosphoribohydrolase n=1 Tax=Chlamydomonas eustigma TaxID=1157962 RepID=A0A250XFK0_9CHLO|nr:hypothetical protein CEUSTIGMA_g9261.t1 [Chlamydomonas eustigma]|eukprot:GAX81833.1 hypothetical protein CEUSTIGMA_g9261.t1 [Chlamydomonas eustigma]
MIVASSCPVFKKRSTLHRPPRSVLSRPGAKIESAVEDKAVMSEVKRICVFCGSASGIKPEYEAVAAALGEHMVQQGIGLVYGGGTVGLMGVIGRTVFKGLGDEGVIGIIPESLTPKEVSGEMIGTLQIVEDMHTRKALMAKHADGFIAMPGGFGTMEELMEVLTWQQLGFHSKPVGLLNIAGFYDPLVSFFKHCVDEGFVKAQYNAVIVSSDPAELIQKMREFKAPESIIGRRLREKGPDGIDVSTH